jgi:phosphatidylserine/phosphatidylglycerophosphate/cardiolipin synthase-like enzyme
MKNKIFFGLCLFLFFANPLRASSEQNTRVIVCEHGLEMFHWDLAFLKEAKYSVEALVCFFGGDVARELLTAIKVRMEEVPDLQVYLLASPVFIEEEDWQLIHQLRRERPNHFHFELATQYPKLSPDLLSIDNHVKMFVVDETYFSAGGTNLEERHCSEGNCKPCKEKKCNSEIDTLMPAGMRDQDVVGRGPIARELRKTFYKLYSLWEFYNKTKIFKENPEDFSKNTHYFEVPAAPHLELFENSKKVRDLKNQQIKMLLNGPHQKKGDITEEYISLIRQAKEEIILEHFYFLPIDPILQALMDAVNRGVKLTLITNGLSELSPKGAPFFVWGNRMSYVPILYGNKFHFWDAWRVASKPIKNTEIYEYYVEDVFLHKKMLLVDKRFFVFGSYNLGIKSAYGDYELVLVIDSPDVAQDVLKVHQADIANSKKVSPELARKWYFDPVISYWGELQKRFSGFL